MRDCVCECVWDCVGHCVRVRCVLSAVHPHSCGEGGEGGGGGVGLSVGKLFRTAVNLFTDASM